jgi:hypothetical protein
VGYSKVNILSEKDKSKEDEVKKLTGGVWIKYKEGFINAIRYNVKINQLL